MKDQIRLVSALLLVACQKNVATPPGTEVLRWDRAASWRPDVVSAKEPASRSAKDFKVTATPETRGAVTLDVHLETAELDIGGAGKSALHTLPVALRVVVRSNADWTASGKCLDGPHFQMGPMAGGVMLSPKAMILECKVVLKYASTTKDLSYNVELDLYGDGTVKPNLAGGSVRIEP